MMKRLTSDDTKSIFYDLNLFFAKDNEVWIRGGGPEPDYQDCTLVNWIGRVADKHNLEIYARDAVNLGDEMYDCLQYGIDTIEGVVALLHTAAVQATTMRSRLKEIEDILGDDYDLDRLKELVEADREGRCAVTPCKQGDIVYLITEPQNVKGLDLGDVPDTEYEKKRVFECIVGSITIWDGGSHIQIILLHNGERVAHYIQPKDFKNGVVHFNRENAEAVLQNHKDQEKLPEAYQHQIMSRFCRKD